MPGLATAVTVDLGGPAAVDGHMAHLTTPVALDLVALFLNVAVFATTVALLLLLMVAITSQMALSATRITAQLSLLLKLDTVFGDVATSPTVVADVLEKVTVPSVMP